MSERTTLVRTIKGWIGGYVAVGLAIAKLQELEGRDFAGSCLDRFDITYNRTQQIRHAAEMGAYLESQEKAVPHNEALAYRLYSLSRDFAKASEATNREDKVKEGQKKVLDVWEAVLAQSQHPTVAVINRLVRPARPEPEPATAAKWLGKAIAALQEAVNLPADGDLSPMLDDAAKLLKQLKKAG